ncbi:MAG: class I SAM-dependent methyltransferase [Verrucomicrobiota bacterium]
MRQLAKRFSLRGVYHKNLDRRVRQLASQASSPQLIAGEIAPDDFVVRENSVQFALSFSEGYSVGLFLDQRENRRRLLTRYVAPRFFLESEPGKISGAPVGVLNTFSYTCGFSVCAAISGARVTSLDLSKKYLDWGKRNFALNQLDPAAHEFIFGDAFDWMKRLAKKKRTFDVVILDPPTFSNSKAEEIFQAGRDYGKLVRAALPLLKSGGVLLASTNAANLKPETFLTTVESAVGSAQRKIMLQHYVPQPVDFPISRDEPAYLKTAWLKID